jgi:hypothetical protein
MGRLRGHAPLPRRLLHIKVHNPNGGCKGIRRLLVNEMCWMIADPLPAAGKNRLLKLDVSPRAERNEKSVLKGLSSSLLQVCPGNPAFQRTDHRSAVHSLQCVEEGLVTIDWRRASRNCAPCK